MRWIEVITEAKFRQPRLMYHGTSSAFLRSILQQGLVPDPKNKRWANDPQEAQHAFDRSSLYGSYWTSNLMTASSSASNTRKKFGGDDDLIIIAQIAEQSAYADEDDIDHSIRWAACDTVHTLHPHIRSDFWLAIADQLFGTDRTKVQNLFMINLHAHLKGSDQHPPNRELCDSLLDTLVLRSIAFEKKNGLTFSHWVTALKASDIPSIKELEQQLLDLRERISRAYRSSAFYNQDKFNHTLRTPLKVGFRGANRIGWILQIKPWRWEDIDGKSKLVIDPIILAYGDPNLPADVLEQYRQRVGKFPGLVDRSGKIVVPSERD